MSNSAPSRAASVERSTKETQVRLELELDGSGRAEVSTGVGFFDHMLDLLTRHARLNLTVSAIGDLETGAHHTIEDVGIVLGQALDRALGDRRGITRYGDAMVPMDEALGACAIDVSGRPFCSFEADRANFGAARTQIAAPPPTPPAVPTVSAAEITGSGP